MRTNISYLNNCWFTNVGEAFIDLGAKTMIDEIWGTNNCCISTTTSMSQWYIDNNREIKSGISKYVNIITKGNYLQRLSSKSFDFSQLFQPDYFILAGMFATSEFVKLKKTSEKILNISKDRNTKIVFLGLGGLKYDNDEIEDFKRYLDMLQPELVVTRDHSTYENYKDVVECIDGIDCAYWIDKCFSPKGVPHNKYEVSTFNYTDEPNEIKKEAEYELIRPWHMQYAFGLSDVKKNIMLSDSPYDYLSIYANAERVYTDLVHATIPSLVYGTPVKFYKYDERARMFESLEGIYKDEKGFLSVNSEQLNITRDNIIAQAKNVLL